MMLTPEEKEILTMYRTLTPEEKEEATQKLRELLEQEKG